MTCLSEEEQKQFEKTCERLLAAAEKLTQQNGEMYLVGALMSNDKLMKKAGGNVKEGMIAPYIKVLEKY